VGKSTPYAPHSKAHYLLFGKEKSIFVNGVIMSYDVLEKEIRQLPESYLEDVSKYIQFLLYQHEQERMSALEESDEVFNAKMQKGLDDARNGRITPWNDIYAKLSEANSEIKNGSQGADAEKFIKDR
jgi:hypothetical protein